MALPTILTGYPLLGTTPHKELVEKSPPEYSFGGISISKNVLTFSKNRNKISRFVTKKNKGEHFYLKI